MYPIDETRSHEPMTVSRGTAAVLSVLSRLFVFILRDGNYDGAVTIRLTFQRMRLNQHQRKIFKALDFIQFV